jgi:hypothetical protein
LTMNVSTPTRDASDVSEDVASEEDISESFTNEEEDSETAALSTADEEKIYPQAADEKKRRGILRVLLLFVVFSGMLAGWGVIVNQQKSNNSTQTQLIVIGSSFEDDFPNSALQESALDWILNEDPAFLPVTTNSATLLERYTAVLFYFATQGDEWTQHNDWLTGSPVCSWSGLECNEQGFIARMDLGTCLLASFCLCSKTVRSLTKYALLCLVNRLDFRG